VNAVIAEDYSHLTASSSTSWSSCSPLSNFVNGHSSTIIHTQGHTDKHIDS